MKATVLFLATLVTMISSPVVPPPDASASRHPRAGPLPETALIVFGSDSVWAEVADTPDKRREGLMYRDELPDGTGMLFVFDGETSRTFWMRNTFVALDIAFLDVNFRIVDIQQMEPESEDLHDSAAPAMFALEVRKGWFAEHGIRVGDRAKVTFDPPGRGPGAR